MELKYIIIWMTVCFLSCVIEAATLQLVSIWFVFGAIVALISGLFGSNFITQCFVFVIISIILISISVPTLKARLKNKHIPLNADRLISKCGVVTETINNNEGVGLVNINGEIWSAKSENNKTIKKGTKILVKEIQGVKLVVNNFEEDNYECMAP